MEDPRCTFKRPFCDCNKSAVLTTAIYDRLLSNGTNVEIGFLCLFCRKYYGYWLHDVNYWLLCRAVEETVGVATVRLTGEIEECVHPSYKSGMIEVGDVNTSYSG